jgi:N-acetylglutamate synthase-like GNAT family acetyltransferase
MSTTPPSKGASTDAGNDSRRGRESQVIRHATQDDVAVLTEMINEAFEVERFFLGGDRISPEEVWRRLERGTFLLLEQDRIPLGCVYAELREDSGFIGLLAVTPERQKSGLSRVLMDAAEEYFRANQCTQAELRVVNLRGELPPYYRHLGYEETGTESLPAEISVMMACHLIVMRKFLRFE